MYGANIVFVGGYDETSAMEARSLDLLVRPAEARDAAAIDRLIVYLDEFHAKARPDLFRIPSGTPRGNSFLKDVLDDPEQQILVATRCGEVVGYAHVVIRETAGTSYRLERRFSEIDTISVDPAAQRLGAGQMLIESARIWAEAKGVKDHQIAVHEFNAKARALYEKLGFVASLTVLRRKG